MVGRHLNGHFFGSAWNASSKSCGVSPVPCWVLLYSQWLFLERRKASCNTRNAFTQGHMCQSWLPSVLHTWGALYCLTLRHLCIFRHGCAGYIVRYGLYIVQHPVYGVGCMLFTVRYGVYRTVCGVCCILYTVWYGVYGVECTVYGIGCRLYSVHHMVWGVGCTVYSIGCALYSTSY